MTRRCALLPLLFALSGCAGLTPAFRGLHLGDEYNTATRSFESGQYAQAAASYEGLIDRMPESDRLEELHFRLARCFEEMVDFEGAERGYQAYLERYPSGAHRDSASEHLSRIAIEKARRASVGEEEIARARRELETLLAEEDRQPGDPEIKYRLGNLFYEIGQYDRAGRYYFEAQGIEADYQERELIQKRLFINEEGEPEALSPDALVQIARDADPLIVFDVHRYRERDNAGAFDAKLVYLVLTGKVRNQGSRTARGVSIEVHFLNAVNEILDIRHVAVGDLAPGEVKAFWGRGSHYDNINNLDDVRFIPRGNW